MVPSRVLLGLLVLAVLGTGGLSAWMSHSGGRRVQAASPAAPPVVTPTLLAGSTPLELEAPARETVRVAEPLPGRGARVAIQAARGSDAPAELAVFLRERSGRGFFGALSGSDLEIAGLLRPVFLADCARIGEALPSNASRLVQRSTSTRSDLDDRWMTTRFPAPVAGCVCLVLEDRVLDAVPFGPGQAQVVLHASLADLRILCSTLVVQVQEAGTGRWLSGASVRLGGAALRPRTATTDVAGRARFEDLPPGMLSITVEAAGHPSRSGRMELASGIPDAVQTVELPRGRTVRGTVVTPLGGARAHEIAAVPAYRAGRLLGSAPRGTPDSRSVFEIRGLEAEEYLVGIVTDAKAPSATDVRAGAVAGWISVDLRADVEPWVRLTLPDESPEDVRAPARGEARGPR